MSRFDELDPDRDDQCPARHVRRVLSGRPRDIGPITVRRALPAPGTRMVGPFIFFDHIGPCVMEPGQAIDVRPHPHIHLATVTYLFEGEIIHRDSLGFEQAIRPGAINWMTAGRGIVHSERTSAEMRKSGGAVHGAQMWVALPSAAENIDPSFVHYPANQLPTTEVDGVTVRVLAGRSFGLESPVATQSPTVLIDADMPTGTSLAIAADYTERALYVASGSVTTGGESFETGQMIVFEGGGEVSIAALESSRLLVIGGEPLDGQRHIWWNFVSSSADSLEAAKADWARGPGATERFALVPGDEDEFIPLPDA